MCVCVCVCVCVYGVRLADIYYQPCACLKLLYTCTCICVCMYVCMHACVEVQMYVCMHACIYAHIHAHTCTHTYIHTHTNGSHLFSFSAGNLSWHSTSFSLVFFPPSLAAFFARLIKKKNTAVFALRLGVDVTRAFAGSSAPCSLWLDPLWEFTLL